MQRLKAFTLVLGLGAGVATLPAWASDYPTRPVRLIVTFPPGGGADILARMVSKQLSERWSQTVLVDNRGGADGALGAALAARSQPDGHTLLMAISTHTVLPSIKKSLGYDLMRDFTPILRMADAPNVVVVNQASTVKSVQDLIALARANPGKLNYPGSGYGGPAHLAGVLFDQLAGTKLQFIPYTGAGPSLVALIGGQVDVMFPAITGALPHVRSGKLRALAITSEKRSPQFPDLPTVSEALPAYVFVGWYGLVARTGTSRAIIDRVYTDTAAILRTTQMGTFLEQQGLTLAVLNPAQFGEYLASELKTSARLAASAGLEKN
ncbi:MAG: Bug family tripartite tricarboxylate transporter substrate binding protein [bacterium]|jgi:tripartite-type tricarboxylate transporter receptor subunit TctC|nr:tripartite tricarboxylate transporter substrate binding protein [Betaproteobacteria bacterium]